ncbi:MAG: TetR/AcrR family transcriptional regulator [Clostridia bacterium]|nr:TetR/AcrR family transcriptional regulator [Clostridia bacterium]
MANRTKVEIMETFEEILREKQIENINVKDITDKCGLNRKTFYYYFSDIDDLMNKTFDYEVKYYIKNVNSESSERSAVIGFFDMVYKNKEIVYHIYNSSRHEHLTTFIETALFNAIREASERYKLEYNVTDRQLDLASQALAAIVSSYIIRWVDDGMETDIKLLVDETYVITKGLMKYMVENAHEANEGNK